MLGKLSHMKNLFMLAFLIIIYISSSQSVVAIEKTATVKVSELNVREGPGLSFPVITTLKKNEIFPVLSEKKDWLQLKIDNSQGWVANWLVNLESNTSMTKIKPTVDALRVRTGPDTTFQIIGHIYPHQSFIKLQDTGTWTEIKYEDSKAWVFTKFTKIIDSTKTSTSETDTDIVKNKNSQDRTNIGEITATILNVRSRPVLDAEIIGKLKENERVAIINKENDWYHISFEEKDAWIYGEYVELISSNQKQEDSIPEKEITVVNATILNVRSQPSLDAKILGKLFEGESIESISTTVDWTKIKFNNGEAWVASEFLATKKQEKSEVIILHNGTNIRKGPSTNTAVVQRAYEGDRFEILGLEGDWYRIKLPNKEIAFVAGWIVETNGQVEKVERPGITKFLKDKIIIIDPGHGGKDPGTTGMNGTIEKELTLKTAKLIVEKLNAAGAKAIITRKDDRYISLKDRVSLAHYYHADAFISLHYDSTPYMYVNGITSFYYEKGKDLTLSKAIHRELIKGTGLSDRKVRQANYFVLRENKQPSVLLELGFLSNKNEEYKVKTSDYQEKATQAIYTGLAHYFKEN